MQATLYCLPDDQDAGGFSSWLVEDFCLEPAGGSSDTLDYYDTFDGRLFSRSLMLCRRDRAFELYPLSATRPLARQVVDGALKFAGDLSDGELKAAIAAITEPRALLPLVQVRADRKHYRMLNSDRKTVLRLTVETLTPQERPAPRPATYLWLEPVRGYPKPAKRLARRLKELGLRRTDPKDRYGRVLEAATVRPGDYDPKPKLRLDPGLPAEEAARAVLRFLLGVMKLNEAHIVGDVDSEFLHDFRVSVRRTRVALGQLRGVFPAAQVERFKRDFSYLGQLTGELRDLDVYLLSEPAYRELLPEALQGDIAPLFDHLRSKRKGALGKVRRGLASKRYLDILAAWEAFLDAPSAGSDDAPNAKRPISEVAGERIDRRYRKVLKVGRRILEQADDDGMHALRIDCKKLRYLMEFFVSLYPRKKLNRFIAQLKVLQDNLGSFHDLQVQEDYLLKVAAELPAQDEQGRRALLAVGSLVDKLEVERQQVKAEFAETFRAFAAPDNRKLARALFSPPVGVGR